MSAIIAAEETLVIETPERVSLHFALASTGNRFLACAFDHFLQAVLIAVLLGGTYWFIQYLRLEESFGDAPKWVQAILIILVFLIWSSYFIIFEWLLSGQTPGKK